MKISSKRHGRGARIFVAPFVAFALCFAGVGLAGSIANAQTMKSTDAKMPSKRKSDEEIKAIALKAVPGKAMDVQIERKLGANRYVVEVLSEKDGGAEVDVIIDMDTYKVLGLDR